MNKTSKIIGLCAVGLLCSCSGGNKWHIDGKISGLNDGDLVVLEGNNQGYWYPMDTIEVAKTVHTPTAVKPRVIPTSIASA